MIGWDTENEKPMDNSLGLFGKVSAFSVTVEEQGRRTLHAHILIWVSEINQAREDLHSPLQTVKKSCRKAYN